jgi:hypothetical protein
LKRSVIADSGSLRGAAERGSDGEASPAGDAPDPASVSFEVFEAFEDVGADRAFCSGMVGG